MNEYPRIRLEIQRPHMMSFATHPSHDATAIVAANIRRSRSISRLLTIRDMKCKDRTGLTAGDPGRLPHFAC